MDPENKILKTKSEKVLSAVNNELKKLLPSNASNRRIPNIPKVPKSQTERLAKKIYNSTQKHRQINAPLMTFLESNYKVRDIYTRSARNSTLSPNAHSNTQSKTPDKSPEVIRRQSLKRMISELEGLPRSVSPNLEAVNEIIDACDKASSPKERIIPLVMKNYSRQMDNLAYFVDKTIKRESIRAQSKDIEEKLSQEFYIDGKREMVEVENLDRKIKRDSFKIRQYSMPRHLENFLKQHSRQ